MNILMQKLMAAGFAGYHQEAGAEAGAGAAEQKPTEKPTEQKPAEKPTEQKPAEKPADEAAKALDELTRRAAEAEARATDLAKQLSKFDGVDLEAAKTALEAQTKAERERLEKEGDFKRLTEMMAQEHKTELGAKDKLISETQAELQALKSQIMELTIGNAFANSKFINSELNLSPAKARRVFGDHFEVTEKGEVIAYNKPISAADRTPLVDGSGKHIGFEAAIAKLVDADPDRDTLIRSQLKPGSGSKQSIDRFAPKPQDDAHGHTRIKRGLEALKIQS